MVLLQDSSSRTGARKGVESRMWVNNTSLDINSHHQVQNGYLEGCWLELASVCERERLLLERGLSGSLGYILTARSFLKYRLVLFLIICMTINVWV